MSIRPLITSCLLLSAVYSAHAQTIRTPYGMTPARGNAQQQQAFEKFEGAGTITALGQGKIQVLTDSNQMWVVAVSSKTRVQVTGQASADILRPGMFVQFIAAIDKRGVAADKVAELTVITPSQERLPGIAFRPGADAAKPDGSDPGKSAGSPSTVRGRIAAFKKNTMQVQVDKGSVICELSDNPKVTLDVADLSLVRKGDKIKVQGMKQIGVAGPLQATQVRIELAEPPGEKKKT
jgi:hypothetical protein